MISACRVDGVWQANCGPLPVLRDGKASMSESTINGEFRSTIKGTRDHELRDRSVIFRPPFTLCEKPNVLRGQTTVGGVASGVEKPVFPRALASTKVRFKRVI